MAESHGVDTVPKVSKKVTHYICPLNLVAIGQVMPQTQRDSSLSPRVIAIA